MAKIIRPTYPKELSIGLLLLVFAVALFLSPQVFHLPKHDANEGKNLYVAMFLLSLAVVIMVLVLWEEFLFPIKIKPEAKGIVFRNHRQKLKNQALIYCAIPLIFVFIYYQYEVNLVRFGIWAAICIIAPIAGKLVSGINNYNDFLKLTDEAIQYKNNKEEATFPIKDIQHITLVKDERKVLHKIHVQTNDSKLTTIDLDEMELHDFIASIDSYIAVHYKGLVKA